MNLLQILSLLALLTSAVQAEIKLPPAISDHMVLQCDQADPVWGTAAPNEKVTVEFAGQSKSATADAAGKWMVKLDPMPASAEPKEMTITGSASNQKSTIKDVLVGEVWVGSGQSNMDMQVVSYTKNDPGLAKLASESYPKLRLISKGGKNWVEATPENNEKFSALLFSFGVPLHKAINLPVGLMVGAVGGTPSGNWLSEESYRSDSACAEVVKKFAATYDLEKEKAKYELALAEWKKAADAAKKEGKRAPGAPTPVVPAGECNRGKIGNLYEAFIRPYIPFGIRGVLWDQGESGTAIVGVDQYTLMGALIRGWRKEWGQGDFPFIYIQKPSGGGCAWDLQDPVTNQASKFSPLPKQVPGDKDGAYRELHIKIQGYPNTAMAISSDLGAGIHPTNKSGYGMRASRVALGMVYNQKLEIYGPIYDSQKIEGNKIRLSFTHIGQGLAFRGGEKLQGFIIAGEDKKFHWADATIDGDTVVVSCGEVSNPVAVRYAWSQQFPWANLFNKDGLPAQTFRTDSW